jgi:hypothetical protein
LQVGRTVYPQLLAPYPIQAIFVTGSCSKLLQNGRS